MPRRKQHKIFAKDLKVYETLVTELQKNSVFSDCDFGMSYPPPIDWTVFSKRFDH